MRQYKFIASGLILLMLFTAINTAMKPDAGLLKFSVSGDTAYGNGVTKSRSLSDVRRFLDDNPQVRTLVLQKMPGTQDMTTNRKIARLIRERGLNTRLESRSMIASGAVDLFIAGNRRTMDCGAMIGVHSWQQATPEGALIRGAEFSPRTMGVDRQQNFHEDFLEDMGVDPAFYAFTREAAPPNKLYFLSLDDMKRFGLLTQYPEC